jgi:hypothetical protein
MSMQRPTNEWKLTRSGQFHLVEPESRRRVRLERLSQEFANRLLARHPDWAPYTSSNESEVDGYLQRLILVQVPSEHPAVAQPLLIRTFPEEVYLEWAGWHDHVFWWPGKTMEGFLLDAVDTIDLWVSDEYLFGRVYEGDRVAEEWMCPAGREEPHPRTPGSGRRIIVRSWRGTHDRQLDERQFALPEGEEA